MDSMTPIVPNPSVFVGRLRSVEVCRKQEGKDKGGERSNTLTLPRNQCSAFKNLQLSGTRTDSTGTVLFNSVVTSSHSSFKSTCTEFVVSKRCIKVHAVLWTAMLSLMNKYCNTKS